MRGLKPKKEFLQNYIKVIFTAWLLVVLSMVIGTCGYHFFAHLGWVDSVLNAAMILTGMGPVNPMHSAASKLFATFYSLYSGIAFLTIASMLFAPVFHRFLHRFHIDVYGSDEEKE